MNLLTNFVNQSKPTHRPTNPDETVEPTTNETVEPTAKPTSTPTRRPTVSSLYNIFLCVCFLSGELNEIFVHQSKPTHRPTNPDETVEPTAKPTSRPTREPTVSSQGYLLL